MSTAHVGERVFQAFIAKIQDALSTILRVGMWKYRGVPVYVTKDSQAIFAITPIVNRFNRRLNQTSIEAPTIETTTTSKEDGAVSPTTSVFHQHIYHQFDF